MPQYGEHRYGRFKYGKYRLSNGGGGDGGAHTLGPHIRYRMRTIGHNGKPSEFITMCESRASIPSRELLKTRIRAGKGDWVRAQNDIVKGDTIKVRIRSIESDGGMSPWVYGDRGRLS